MREESYGYARFYWLAEEATSRQNRSRFSMTGAGKIAHIKLQASYGETFSKQAALKDVEKALQNAVHCERAA